MIDTTSSTPRSLQRPRQGLAALRLSTPLFVGLITFALLALTSLPYAFAYTTSPADRHFSGIVFNVPDNVQYRSWMRDHGDALLVSNRMTPEPNAPALFNLLWLFAARLNIATGLGVDTVFHIIRVSAAGAVLAALAVVCARFTRDALERWTSYLICALGGGLGVIWVVDKYLFGLEDVRFPFDIYVAEPNILFSIMAFPHFTIATALILAVFFCYLRAVERRSWPLVALSAALALLLTLQHAYDLLIIGLVPAGALALMLLRDGRVPWFGAWALFCVGVVATPPPAYFAFLTSQDPLWGRVLDQFDNAGAFTPPPQHLLILIGLPLLLVVAQIARSLSALPRRLRNHAPGGPRAWPARLLAGSSDDDLFLWSWALVGFALLYVPTKFQIHMLNAWQIPVTLLAVRFVFRDALPSLPRLKVQPVLLAAVLLLATLPTNLYLVAWRMVDLGRHEAPYFLTGDEQAAMAWLEERTTPDDLVLSGLHLGQFVPARTDARTFIGHWAQTVDYYDKGAAVAQFFTAATDDAERRALLERFSVTYVIQGREERALGSFDAAQSALLEPVFARGEVTVFRVR